jgi:protein-tyrosine phosphatase
LKKILFVCAGNICRSPLAEGIFLHQIFAKGWQNTWGADSAGTGNWHAGERPDDRSISVAAKRGIELPSSARQFKKIDFERFTWILVMDRQNYSEIEKLAESEQVSKIKLMREFDPSAEYEAEVPDPYYGGMRGFEEVFEQLWKANEGLIKFLGQNP